ncbi:hypothetical protein LCGC14_1871700 [marine sediment metagenome]|uniref:Uncharacterized protein n=1 Tax=marine sediment metagenome TaxID=412755 RepID=A0A0F9J3J6_9ZZZZ
MKEFIVEVWGNYTTLIKKKLFIQSNAGLDLPGSPSRKSSRDTRNSGSGAIDTGEAPIGSLNTRKY